VTLFRPDGIIPALVTPFKKDNEVNEEALRDLVNFVVEKGVNGVVPVGTTGEFVYLSEEERRKVVEIVVDEVSGRVSVIAGTGASSTGQAIELSKHAEDVGADAVLVVSPYYLRPADKGAYQHFYDISQATDMPIMLYNIPQCTGDFLSREVVEDLAELDNVVGLKDSSGHFPYLMELLEMVGDKINIVCGHDEVVLPALAAGAKGAILASANVIPDLWIKLHEAIRKGDLEKARKMQMDAQKLARIFCRHGGAVAVKAALKMVGLNVGKARRPLVSGGVLSWEIREEIRMELEKLGRVNPQPTETKLVCQKPLEESFQDLGITRENIRQQKLLVGEGFAGEGTEASRINLVAGLKDGSVGYALTRALANPKPGHEALTAILEVNLAVKPSTLIVPTVEIKNLRQASIVYGPVQSAVGRAVSDAIEKNLILTEALESYAIVAKVAIHPGALNRRALYRNTYEAATTAIEQAWGQRRGS
jgi:4-hydroxy-tetrahydrodipicolinate synthase